MKAEKEVSAYTIDNALYKAYRKSLDFKYSGDRRTAYVAMTVNYALHYYVNTGRASVPFLRALVNLSDCRMNTLFKKCIKADTGTEADAIQEIKKYLKVE